MMMHVCKFNHYRYMGIVAKTNHKISVAATVASLCSLAPFLFRSTYFTLQPSRS